MSFFDISNLANKFAGFDIPPDADYEQRSDDYGYTHTDDHSAGYNGSPPSSYPGGPQDGEEEYRSAHPDYSTSDPTRNGLGDGNTHAYNPSAQEIDDTAEDSQGYEGESQQAPPLPEGWSKRFDDRYGRSYYVNEESGATQWERPTRGSPGADDEEGRDDAGHGGHEHDPDKPWYDQNSSHAHGGEAAGFYAGNEYQANRPYEDGAFQQAGDEGGGYPQGSGEGQRSFGGEGGYPHGGGDGQRSFGGGGEADEGGGRSSSGYGKAMLGVAGGLAVGAAGGALLAHALGSDSEEEGADLGDDDQGTRSAYAEYGEVAEDAPGSEDEAPESDSSLADSSDDEPEPEGQVEDEPAALSDSSSHPDSDAEEEVEVLERGVPQEEEQEVKSDSSSASDVEEEEDSSDSRSASSEDADEDERGDAVEDEDEYVDGGYGGGSNGEESFDADDFGY